MSFSQILRDLFATILRSEDCCIFEMCSHSVCQWNSFYILILQLMIPCDVIPKNVNRIWFCHKFKFVAKKVNSPQQCWFNTNFLWPNCLTQALFMDALVRFIAVQQFIWSKRLIFFVKIQKFLNKCTQILWFVLVYNINTINKKKQAFLFQTKFRNLLSNQISHQNDNTRILCTIKWCQT